MSTGGHPAGNQIIIAPSETPTKNAKSLTVLQQSRKIGEKLAEVLVLSQLGYLGYSAPFRLSQLGYLGNKWRALKRFWSARSLLTLRRYFKI